MKLIFTHAALRFHAAVLRCEDDFSIYLCFRSTGHVTSVVKTRMCTHVAGKLRRWYWKWSWTITFWRCKLSWTTFGFGLVAEFIISERLCFQGNIWFGRYVGSVILYVI
jgi:hypothetical protein